MTATKQIADDLVDFFKKNAEAYSRKADLMMGELEIIYEVSADRPGRASFMMSPQMKRHVGQICHIANDFSMIYKNIVEFKKTCSGEPCYRGIIRMALSAADEHGLYSRMSYEDIYLFMQAQQKINRVMQQEQAALPMKQDTPDLSP